MSLSEHFQFRFQTLQDFFNQLQWVSYQKLIAGIVNFRFDFYDNDFVLYLDSNQQKVYPPLDGQQGHPGFQQSQTYDANPNAVHATVITQQPGEHLNCFTFY